MRLSARLFLIGSALLPLLAAAPPAFADRLDGHWCRPGGQRLTIDGPRIVTPGGAQLTGDYRRHTFRYTVPAGEPGAGEMAEIVQLSDRRMEFRVGAGPVERWSRCAPPGS